MAGRPQKATVDYFPHTTDHGKTMFILESRWGNDGYAAWYKTLELLGKADNHYVDCRDIATFEHLVAYIRVDRNTTREILDTLAQLGAIDTEMWMSFNVIYSANFVEGIQPAYRWRKDKILTRENIIELISHVGNTANLRFPTQQLPKTGINHGEMPQIRGDKIRLDENIKSSSQEISPEIAKEPTPAADQKEMMTTKISLMEFRHLHEQTFHKFMPGNLNEKATRYCMRHPRDALEQAFLSAASHGANAVEYVFRTLDNQVNDNGHRRPNNTGGASAASGGQASQFDDPLTRAFCEG